MTKLYNSGCITPHKGVDNSRKYKMLMRSRIEFAIKPTSIKKCRYHGGDLMSHPKIRRTTRTILDWFIQNALLLWLRPRLATCQEKVEKKKI